MDIQVLNEIANQVRQASLSQVRTPVFAHTQPGALKGNPVPASGNPLPPPFENSPEQTGDPVTPEISSVARAASSYSAAVGSGLNSDELNAIQDLAGDVRSEVSDFLSQPGLEQAENAAAVVASNPEAVQDLTSSVEQAVAAILSQPESRGEVVINAAPPNADLLEEVPSPVEFVSVERITNGAELNNPVIAASPAGVHSRAGENTSVENPVTVGNVPESSSGDFRVAAASPALHNAQARENAPVENPVSQPGTESHKNLESPATVSNPLPVNPPANENSHVENSVTVPGVPESSSGDFRVTAASPAVQNGPSGGNAQEETPVIAASPALHNAQARESAPVETPVSRLDGGPPNNQAPVVTTARPEVQNVPSGGNAQEETPVTAASPALQNAQARESAPVETPVSPVAASLQQEPVSRAVASPQQESVSRPETIPANPQEAPVIAASPALQNAQARDHARVETPVSRSETVSSNPQEVPVIAASPALQNAQAQNAKAGNPVPAPSVNQGQSPEGAQPINSEGSVASHAGAKSPQVSEPSNLQPASGPQPVPFQSNDLFASENAAVNPNNIRNVNELVNSVVGNEFTSEAKKIFSEPKVIRTVADLADFILERLQEIIAAKLQHSQSSGKIEIS